MDLQVSAGQSSGCSVYSEGKCLEPKSKDCDMCCLHCEFFCKDVCWGSSKE